MPQINYDETNLSDNPGVKKFIFNYGVKNAETNVSNTVIWTNWDSLLSPAGAGQADRPNALVCFKIMYIKHPTVRKLRLRLLCKLATTLYT